MGALGWWVEAGLPVAVLAVRTFLKERALAR